MTIYTDGSGIMEKIGAAAYNQTLNETAHQHLGKHSEYNVYSAELTALDLGAIMWQNHAHDYPQCYIFIDSQAACSSIQQPRRQSGQCILASILDRFDQIMEHHPQRKLKIIWIPGHMDIEGNEYVDQEAKRAATDPTVHQLFRHPPLKSSRIQQIKAMAKIQWNRQWTENTETSKHLRRISSKQGIQLGMKLYNSIPVRKTCAQVVQLRTGHCGLNKYLHRFGKRYSPYCSCGYAKETVEHFILECPNYKTQRKELRKRVDAWKMRIDKLLGDITLLKYTMEYVRTTKRMDN
jgi:ribonuclease HI